MTPSKLIKATAEEIRSRFSNEATGHDWWHMYRVWQMAKRIGRVEGGDMLVIELAALLHDIADWKFHAGDENEGPKHARHWLQGLGVDEPVIDHVCRIIGDLSFKGAGVPTPMRSLEGMIVQDADRLDALGAIGIARAFAYGGYKGTPLHDPATPPVLHATFEEYKAHRNRQGHAGTTINHFHEKLLLLKDRMNTPAARRIAADRHAFMQEFLRRFESEWHHGDHLQE